MPRPNFQNNLKFGTAQKYFSNIWHTIDVEICEIFSVFLSSMRKVFLPQRKVRWGSLSSGSLCNKTFTAWCINVPFFVNRPTWMNLSVWEIGSKLGSDPGIKNFGIDCDCGASAVNFDLGSLVLSWMELGQPRPIPSSKSIFTMIIMITIIMITITINLVLQVLVLCSVRPTANTRKVLVVATQDGRGQSAL